MGVFWPQAVFLQVQSKGRVAQSGGHPDEYYGDELLGVG